MAGNFNPFFTVLGGDPFGSVGGQGRGPEPNIPHVDFNGEFNQIKDRFTSVSKKTIVVLLVIAAIALGIAYWWFHPPINIHSMDMWLAIFVVILVPAYLFFKG